MGFLNTVDTSGFRQNNKAGAQGPFTAANGARYTVATQPDVALGIFKSDDLGVTWNPLDAADNPVPNTRHFTACISNDGKTIYVLYVSTTPHYCVSLFDTTTDTWGATFESVDPPGVIAGQIDLDDQNTGSFTAVLRPDDTIVFLTATDYDATNNIVIPGFNVFDTSGNTWGLAWIDLSYNIPGSGASAVNFVNAAVLLPGGIVQAFYESIPATNLTDLSTFLQQAINADNSLGTLATIAGITFEPSDSPAPNGARAVALGSDVWFVTTTVDQTPNNEMIYTAGTAADPIAFAAPTLIATGNELQILDVAAVPNSNGAFAIEVGATDSMDYFESPQSGGAYLIHFNEADDPTDYNYAFSPDAATAFGADVLIGNDANSSTLSAKGIDLGGSPPTPPAPGYTPKLAPPTVKVLPDWIHCCGGSQMRCIWQERAQAQYIQVGKVIYHDRQ